jgi:hypothetical protein
MDVAGGCLLYDGFGAFEATLAPAKSEDVLELDEVWSFVLKKANNE